MEEQTLHYYLKVFSITLFVFLILASLYIFFIFNKNLIIYKNPIIIKQGQSLEEIFKKNINNLNSIDIEIVKIYFNIDKLLKKNFVHYGEFKIKKKVSLIDFKNIITKPSNVLKKITIVEGWSQNELNLLLSKNFKDFYQIPYNLVIADTYFIQKNSNFESFVEELIKIKNNFFKKFQNNDLLNNYSQNEIMVMGSLLEKEGLDVIDKKKISSVIINRLNKNMKLQIDATVIYSITEGNYNLQRKLLLTDLKIDHPYNTYVNKGLPPQPISYVGKQTLNILFQNYESDFLFYFFNKSLNRHIFSNTFKEHKEKLNEYRKK